MRRTTEILQAIRSMDTKLERLDVAIITRYPDSERAADNYDALRKALIAGGSAASRHVSDLLTLASALDEGATTETIRLKINDLLQVLEVVEVPVDQAGDIPEHRVRDYFDVVGDKAHPRSAWLRIQDGVPVPIRKGYLAELPANVAPSVPAQPSVEEQISSPISEEADPVTTVEVEPTAQGIDESPAVSSDAPASPDTER